MKEFRYVYCDRVVSLKVKTYPFFDSDLKIQSMNKTEAEWKFRLLLNTPLFLAVTEQNNNHV